MTDTTRERQRIVVMTDTTRERQRIVVMTDTTRERQRIVAMIEELKAQAIRDCRRHPENVMYTALAVIGTYQECIDKIMEATDV